MSHREIARLPLSLVENLIVTMPFPVDEGARIRDTRALKRVAAKITVRRR